MEAKIVQENGKVYLEVGVSSDWPEQSKPCRIEIAMSEVGDVLLSTTDKYQDFRGATNTSVRIRQY